jgi:hypothetical protein
VHPVLISSADSRFGDFGDTRASEWSLEHAHRWLLGVEGHEELWSPPAFFPAKGSLLWNHPPVGRLPFYTTFRILGFSAELAQQAMLPLFATLNFIAGFVLARWGLGFSTVPSAMGAYLLSFGLPVVGLAQYPQYWILFPGLLALFGAARIVRSTKSSEALAGGALLGGGLAWELYSCVQYAWFLTFFLASCVTVVALSPTLRAYALERRANLVGGVVLAVALFGLLATPLLLQVDDAEGATGGYSWEEVEANLPSWATWIYQGRRSPLYAPIRNWQPYRELRPEFDQRAGVGFVTLGLALTGLALGRRRPEVRLVSLAGAAILAVSTLEIGGYALWKAVFSFFPGAGVVRSPGRLGLILLLVWVVGVASLFRRLEGSRVLPLVAALIVAEQVYSQPVWSSRVAKDRTTEVARAARDVPCESFFVVAVLPTVPPEASWYLQVDAMLASLEVGKPTVNGHAGPMPAAYGRLRHNIVQSRDALAEIRASLDAWMLVHGRAPRQVCLVEVDRSPT